MLETICSAASAALFLSASARVHALPFAREWLGGGNARTSLGSSLPGVSTKGA
jgi:hypothetical protein